MKQKRQKKRPERQICFTGGGTGGHVFPALAVAQELVRRGVVAQENLVWIGSRKGIEREITGRLNWRYKAVSSGKLRRYFSVRNFLDLFKIASGLFETFFYLLFNRPAVIFSKGGFVSVAPCVAGRLLGIPVITHESDMTPGLATRINSRFASLVLTAYPETLSLIPGSVRREVSGNPVREEIFKGSAQAGREFCRAPEGKPVILVLGGSLGAASLNLLVDGARMSLGEKIYFIHQTGERDYHELNDESGLKVPFFNEEFPDVLAAADLVVSRAGAGTLWENAAAGKPAILIPLGRASSRGDQIINASYFEKLGTAEVLDETTADSQQLADCISALLSDEKKLTTMREALAGVSGEIPAAHKAADSIVNLMGGAQ